MPSSMHHCRHSSSQNGPQHANYDSTWFPASPSRQSSLERPTRGHSRDSAYSRSDREGSNDRTLMNLPNPSPMTRALKIPSYDRMVCDAVTRLKSKKGSTIRDIAKTIKTKYAHGLKTGSAAKISSAARRLVREGKFVKNGNHFMVRRVRRGTGGDDDSDDDRPSRGSRRYRSSSESPAPRTRQCRRRRRRRHRSRSRSRSRSRGRHRRRRHRKGRRHRRHRRGRRRGASGSSVRRGRRRKKGGNRSRKRKLSYNRRYPHQRRYSRGKRRVKHSYRSRPKPNTNAPQENSEGGKGGWFGRWFGKKGNKGQSSNSGQGSGSGSGSANKSGNTRDKDSASK